MSSKERSVERWVRRRVRVRYSDKAIDIGRRVAMGKMGVIR